MSSTTLSSFRKPLIKNSFYLYIVHFADYLLLLFILPFISRALGPTALGHIGLAQTFGLLVMMFLEFGFSITAMRQISSNINNESKIQLVASEVFSFKIFLVPIVILCSLLIIFSHPVFFYQPELIIISVLASIFHSFIPTWYFQGIQNFKQIALVKLIFRSFAFFLALLIVKSPSDGWLYLLIQGISSFLIAFVLIIIMVKRIGKIKFLAFRKVQPILKSSFAGFTVLILPTIFNNIGIFLLSYLITPVLLGYYYGVSRIHRAFNTLYSPLFESFSPYLISTYQKDQKKAFNKTIFFNVIVLILGCCFSIIIWFFSEIIISTILGDAFLPSANYLRAFGLLLPITVIAYIWGNQWMIALKKEGELARILLISNLIGIFCLVLTITKLEIFAIPVSITFSELTKLVLIIKSIK